MQLARAGAASGKVRPSTRGHPSIDLAMIVSAEIRLAEKPVSMLPISVESPRICAPAWVAMRWISVALSSSPTMIVFNVDVLEAWREPNDILAFSKVIAPLEGEPIIRKQFYSGFHETHLESLLRSLDTRNLVVVGFDSRICLATTVIDAMYRNYRVIVLRDCIGTAAEATGSDSANAERDRAGEDAIRFIETNVGYTSTSSQWIAACAAAETAK
jgi:hypothetical protein